MATKEMLVQCFNTKMDEFLRDLILVFPEEQDFKAFKHSFNLIRLVDEAKPQRLFHVVLPKYKEHIVSRNSEFFLTHNYEDLNQAITVNTNDDIAQELINKLKKYWQELNDDNRETVWKYLNLLVALDEKCAAL